ncbi:MAG: hypothetical protein JNM17_33595 [Archangium sp.]|nr:hypothetical protein [Archangium sp.]
MLTVALSLMLSQSVPYPEPSPQGALITEAPRSVRLLEDTVLAQLPPAPPPADAPLASPQPFVSAQQLQVDIAALKRMRPGIGGGIALIAAGSGLAIAGGFYIAIGLAATVAPVWAIGVGALAVGLPLAVIGIWLLVNAIPERARIDDEIGKLRRELTQVQAGAPPAPPGPSGMNSQPF